MSPQPSPLIVARPVIVGRPALVVVDIQEGGAMHADVTGIAIMPGHAERLARARALVEAARAADIPIVFFQEVHRRSGVDFGRELDGTEGVHCVDGAPGTALEPTLLPGMTTAGSSISSSAGIRDSSGRNSRSCCAASAYRR